MYSKCTDDGGWTSILMYGAIIRAGYSSDTSSNPVCGEEVALDKTTNSDLEFPCNDRFGRYVSIEQSGTYSQLRACEVEVYADFVHYVSLGCYTDDPYSRVFPVNSNLENNDLVSDLLDGIYRHRQDAFKKCSLAANRLGFLVFSLQNGGKCWAGNTLGLTYDMYGTSNVCADDGEGGLLANHVYLRVNGFRKSVPGRFVSLGCFVQSASDPAIPPIEGTDDKLSDDYKQRSQAIRKCAIVSAKQGFPIFGIHDGGQCVSSDTAWLTYDKNGESTDCEDGKGALNAIDVYAIIYNNDEISPEMNCSKIVETTSPGLDVNIISEYDIQVTDNVDIESDIKISCDPSQGATFPVGETNVTCVATDSSFNNQSCNFTVLIEDKESPIPECPDMTIETLPGADYGEVSAFDVTATDNVDGQENIVIACTHDTNSRFCFGITSVSCNFTDRASNTASCTFAVNVEDNEPPTVTCADQTITRFKLPAAYKNYNGGITFSDNVYDNSDIEMTCDPPEGSQFGEGDTPVSCNFTDPSSNVYQCNFIVTGKILELICPKDMVKTILEIFSTPETANAVVSWEPPQTNNQTDIKLLCTHKPGKKFQRGNTTVTYTAQDETSLDNLTSCSFNIEVGKPCVVEETLDDPKTLAIPHGDRVSFGCFDGFSLSHTDRISCHDGIFSQALPLCKDTDECETGNHTCDEVNKNSFCVNERASYTCHCLDGYTKQDGDDDTCVPDVKEQDDKLTCQEGEDTMKCSPEDDKTNNITWPGTNAGCYTPWLKCPPGTLGNIRRECSTEGEWYSSDTTFCTSESLTELKKRAKNINTTDDATKLVDETTKLVSIENLVVGGDLLVAINILNTVLDKKPLMLTTDTDSKKYFVQNFVKIANDLLDVNNEEQWQRIHMDKGVHKGSSLVFKALAKFGKDVAKFVNNHNDSVYWSYNNIEYHAYLTSNESNRMETVITDNQGLSKMKKRSTETVNERTDVVPSIVLKDSTNATVGITFQYNVKGAVLPVGDGSDKSKLRQWVRSVTAVARVQIVNTPVLSVMMYSKTGKQLALNNSFSVTMNHWEEGYDPECVEMVYGKSKSIWDKSKCTVQESDEYATTCECNHSGNVAVLMIQGTKPTPFLIEARNTFVLIFNGLAIFILVVAAGFVFYSRIKSDRYYLLGMSVLSFTIMPLLILVCYNTNIRTVSRFLLLCVLEKYHV
ncbi:uncharacterized protein LOC144451013 [Glandiceps talaboti]